MNGLQKKCENIHFGNLGPKRPMLNSFCKKGQNGNFFKKRLENFCHRRKMAKIANFEHFLLQKNGKFWTKFHKLACNFLFCLSDT